MLNGKYEFEVWQGKTTIHEFGRSPTGMNSYFKLLEAREALALSVETRKAAVAGALDVVSKWKRQKQSEGGRTPTKSVRPRSSSEH